MRFVIGFVIGAGLGAIVATLASGQAGSALREQIEQRRGGRSPSDGS